MAHTEPELWDDTDVPVQRHRLSELRTKVAQGLVTLKARLTLAAMGSLIIGIGLISALSLRQVEVDLVAQARDRELSETTRVASELAQRAVMLQRLVSSTADQIDPALEQIDDALEQHLQAQPALLQHFANVFVAAPDGHIRLFVDEAGTRRPQVSIADRPYFKQVMTERRPIISEPVPGRISGQPVIIFSTPIVRDGKVTSIFGGALRLASKSLAASLLEREFDANGGELLAISDTMGHVIAHGARSLALKHIGDDPRLSRAVASWTDSGGPAEPSGLLLPQEGEIVSAAGVAGTSWVVWRAVPESTLLAPLREARLQALRNAVIVIGMLGALTLWGVWRLLSPLHQLEQRARTLFAAQLDVHQGWPTAGGEIGSLVHVLRHVGAERAHLESFTRQVVSRLSSVMDAAPLGIAFTRNQKFELVSKAWCSLLQREEHELLGGATSEVFAEEGDYRLLGAQVGAAFLAQGTYEGEWRFRRKDGTEFWGQLCGRPADTQDVTAGTIWTLADVTASRTNREQLEWSSTHDPLTGLANRKAFEHKLDQVMGHSPAAVLMIDLDRFKPINDTHGHAAGDEMLKAVALALSANVRSGDVVARLGGDEFAVILERCPPDAAERVAAQALKAVMASRARWADTSLSVGASIGLACLDIQYSSAAEWVADADRACYAAKAAGRGTLRSANSSSTAPTS